MRRPLSIATLYLASLLQGLTLVSFPASSAILKAAHGFSDAQYGAIFLPQVAAAVIGALAGGGLARRFGLKALLAIALAVNALSQCLLAGTATLAPGAALTVVLLGTASLGAAFGLSGAPLNGFPPLLFPERRDTAIVAVHTFMGLGLAIGPIVAQRFVAAGRWPAFPLTLAAIAIVLLVATQCSRFPPTLSRGEAGVSRTSAARPTQAQSFWLLVGIAMLYAFAEGTFGNWAVIYLQDVKRYPEAVASGALSAFWAAMVTGRLLASLLVLRVAPARIWLALPILMIAALLSLPYASTPALGIGLFALSGLACSAFFPLTIGIASERFRADGAWVSSMLIAALMVGVGVGSYAIGLLREAFAMETLYRLSVVYPLLVLALGVWALRAIANEAAPAARRI